MKIWFIGGVFPKERIKEFVENSKSTIQYAANNFQWTFIDGLSEHIGYIKIISAPLLPTYPSGYKKIFIKRSKFSYNNNFDNISVGFVNLPIVGIFSKFASLLLKLFSQKSKPDIFLVYSLHTPFILSSILYKKLINTCKVVLIITDLPEFMSANTSFFYRTFKKIDSRVLKWCEKRVDGFVLITDSMIEKVNVGSKPWIRVEGMFDPNRISKIDETEKTQEKTILYTGTLDVRYGISNLLEAFQLIPDKSYKLWICGDGDMKDKVKKFSSENTNIIYYGQVTTEFALSLQQKASVLVNPRTSIGEYTRYSFPIKTMEYLASGIPTIMNMLPGIPSEYRKYLIVPDDESVVSLKKKIMEVCECKNGIYIDLAKKGKIFILEYKNPKIQTLRVFNLLQNIFPDKR